MIPRTLRFRVGLRVAIALSVAMLLFILLSVRYQRSQMIQEASNTVHQVSDVIVRSMRFAMLQNRPDYTHGIMEDVARQESIEKVRILSKEGKVIDSSLPGEIGSSIDSKAEGCVQCHANDKPLVRMPRGNGERIFTAPDGRRMLASMAVIRNEPSCYNAACHQHSVEQQVLGVLDIVYSLEHSDRAINRNAWTIALLALGFVLVASTAVSLFIRRLVVLPLRDLESGARRLASGNLEQPIPVRSADEFGQLAGSFNAMTEALRTSRDELESSARTLEQKVHERTRALRAAQAETARGEKLASVGLLASGIAHELNNPLTGVLTFSHLVRKKMPPGSTEAEDLDLVIRETQRCAAIIRRLLDFAREQAPEKKFVDLNRIIEETARIVERPAHLAEIDVRLELDRGLPQVWADADLVKQVVMNMLVNAQHAIDQEGTITVTTRPVAPRPTQAGGDPVPMVEIAIADTGCGIPEENLQRIFDPFFTSKEVGKGTGLGLSVSHGIVKAHGGSIEVESRVGEGTTFRVLLPVEPHVSERPAARQTA